ncbi:hypothetical protein [Microbispora oryzae]|uniref:hypothetical protein n=1 Tax=Microbispora oryzae TaxID=2806554 RepID=UPI001AEC60F5|nr:hypothetical protein [Microbispora oryzae]
MVTIDEGTVIVLRQHREAQEAEKARVGDAWKGEENGHVFTTAWVAPSTRPR